MATVVNGMLFEDLPGRFQRGRQAAQQNRMAQMAIADREAAMDRQAQVNAMLGQVGDIAPTEQRNYLAQMAGKGPEGIDMAQRVQSMWGNMDDRQRAQMQQKLQQNARMLAGVKDQQSYSAVRNYAIQTNPQLADEMPEQYDPNVVQAFVNRFRDLESVISGQGGRGPNIGTYNPRDYTTESFAQFSQSGDPSVLERYSPLKSVKIAGIPYNYNAETGELTPAMDPETVSQQAEQIKTSESRGAAKGKAEGQRVAEQANPKAIQMRDTARGLVRDLLSPEMINSTKKLFGSIEGSTVGRFFTTDENTLNARAKLEQLQDILTAENLGIMSGVLTDRDIQVIANIAGGGLKGRQSDEQALENLRTLGEKFGIQEAAAPSTPAAPEAAITPDERRRILDDARAYLDGQ